MISKRLKNKPNILYSTPHSKTSWYEELFTENPKWDMHPTQRKFLNRFGSEERFDSEEKRTAWLRGDWRLE